MRRNSPRRSSPTRSSPVRGFEIPTPLYGSSYPPANAELTLNYPHHRQRLAQRTTKKTTKLVLFPQDEEQFNSDQKYRSTETDISPHIDINGPNISHATSMYSYAERLHKTARQAVPRVTSYCIADAFKFPEITEYITESQGISPVQYDECLYFYYEQGTKERLFGIPTPKIYPIPMNRSASGPGAIFATFEEPEVEVPPGKVERGEVFVFDYGVLVLWNFTLQEELSFLAHMKAFAQGRVRKEDMEIEDFHFQYDLEGPNQPRIYNDLITLKSSSPLIKLTISHGLAQSVKLSLFENSMEETIHGAVPLPKMLAEYGVVKMSRTKIMVIIGNLYKLRMDVNLISNVLDTPQMFWSEPGLEGLYKAIRIYLEIQQRATLLNTRADVLADLLSMLSDHLNSSEMTYITWIVIILILMAVVVASAEVVVKVLRMRAGFSE